MHYHYFTLEQREALSRQIQGLLQKKQDTEGIVSALAALRSPAYGVCEACEADIPFVQLLDEPMRRLCRRCSS
jgi:RNA polymerase-binding transcription factor DksA